MTNTTTTQNRTSPTTRRTPTSLPNAFRTDADLTALRLVVAWRPSPNNLQLRQVQLSRSLRDDLTDAARNSLDEIARRRLVGYGAEITLTKDECALAGSTYLDSESLVLRALGDLTYPPAAAADLEQDFQFFAYVVGAPCSELVFITKFNPRRGLRRKRIVRWVDEQLTELQEPVLAFDPNRVDLVWSPPDAMAILDLNVFEFLLRDAPEIIARVPVKVAQLARVIPFAAGSEDVLARAVLADTRLRRRLLAIVERGHLAGHSVVEDVRRALRRGGYRTSDYLDRTGLVVTDDNAATVLQVLNEDILRGEFSGDRFAAERKAPA